MIEKPIRLFGAKLFKYETDIDNTSIKDFCFKLKQKDPGRTVSNYGGWQSNFVSPRTPELEQLTNFIQGIYPDIFNEHLLSKNARLTIDSYWVNINYKHNFNYSHSHHGFISGVYYVDVPENSGKIVFESSETDNFFDNLPSDTWTGLTPYTSTIWRVTPFNGMLLLFPSWLKHRVEPNESEESRTSIAFNIHLKNIKNSVALSQ